MSDDTIVKIDWLISEVFQEYRVFGVIETVGFGVIILIQFILPIMTPIIAHSPLSISK